ncbi:unnamed protein product [Lactuca virosa]|uniref:Transmembrane protein n=1 Tax=Lactuca virosa TaxID=75947 RepID=A0AAU9MLW8_9ASTR|nr:unnamed protein product [Lactuca virosa]
MDNINRWEKKIVRVQNFLGFWTILPLNTVFILTLQRKRRRIVDKKKRIGKAKLEAADYHLLLHKHLGKNGCSINPRFGIMGLVLPFPMITLLLSNPNPRRSIPAATTIDRIFNRHRLWKPSWSQQQLFCRRRSNLTAGDAIGQSNEPTEIKC